MRGSSFECWQQLQPGWLDKPRELTQLYTLEHLQHRVSPVVRVHDQSNCQGKSFGSPVVGSHLIKSGERVEYNTMLREHAHNLSIHNVLAPSLIVEINAVTKPLTLDACLVNHIAIGCHF